MAFFQLMLEARKLEKARLAYQDEKLRSIEISRGAKVHYTLSQKIRRKKIMLKRKLRSCWERATSCPEDSWFHRKAVLFRTEGTFENFILKSVMGFLGGIFLTYMFFMFFVFQLNFALSSATMLCSLFGIILTIGLAFSYRVRCVVFLLLPQFFSKRGRQALMAYAFILALTGPAKNTLHNTGVLSESLACGQEQLKEAVRTIVDLIKQPFYALREAISKVIKTVKVVVKRIKEALMAIKRMVLSILRVIKAVFQWLGSVVNICNKKLGTPFERCQRAFDGAVSDCYAKLGPFFGTVCNLAYVAGALCYIVKPLDFICLLVSFVADTIVGSVRKKIKRFTKHMNAMFYVKVKFSHSFHFETNKSRSLEEISTGIVTEIRSRTERFLTVFDWMSFATSFFVLFMLLRVIHYRQKWLTNERFDNRYLTEDLRHIDLIRAKKDKETVLPLNPREKNKYIPLTSITLIKVEKIKLTKSAVFLLLTTCKLCIHMVADYSLYWVLSTIRHHGRFETKVQKTNAVGVYVSGNGYLAQLYRSIVRAFSPMGADMEMDTVPCLPDPVPPDLDKYTQIVSLIVFCWIMAFFEPYGLRLRHVVMTYYHPDRAKQRAVWLYNHIIRSRGSFLKYARRQLRRKFGMTDGKPIEHITFKEKMFALFPILNKFFNSKEKTCLLCGTPEREGQVPHVKCPTPGCIGIFCTQCFADLQNVCTICQAPMDYGDLSDMSEEKDSSDDQQRPTKLRKIQEESPRTEETLENEQEYDFIDSTEDQTLSTEYSEDRKLSTENSKDQKLLTEDSKDDDSKTNSEEETAEESTDQSMSSEYSQSYQHEERNKVDVLHRRVSYKDVEAQRPYDDVTIQIFNEPLRSDATSGDESPTSCFVVRAHRKLRSRLRGKCRSCDYRDSSSSSSTSIADTESLSTEEVEEEEVIHIEIEDQSECRLLGDGGSKILNKKPGRLKKIVDALGRVSWLQKNYTKSTNRGFQRRRESLMHRVVDMLQPKGPSDPYKRMYRSKSDGDQVEDVYSSSSSTHLDNDDSERRALMDPRDGSRSERTDRDRRKQVRKEQRRCRDYSDDYIYETSWESHRQRGGAELSRSGDYQENDRYSKIASVMSKDTKYYEINEKSTSKYPDDKTSSGTGTTEDTWNIGESEDRQQNSLNKGMSPIKEDSKEHSTIDTRTDTEKSPDDTDRYVDVTGLSSTTTNSPAEAAMKKRDTKYVTEDELAATTIQDRKRRKKATKKRRESQSGPDLYDPLAGLEIYGAHDKEKRKKKFWIRDDTSKTDETSEPQEASVIGKTLEDEEASVIEKTSEEASVPEKALEEEETKTEQSEEKRELPDLDDSKSSVDLKTKEPDSTAYTSGEQRYSSQADDEPREISSEDIPYYQEYRRTLHRRKKDKCGRDRRREKKSKDRHKSDRQCLEKLRDSTNVSTQAETDAGRSGATQNLPEEWFCQEQRRIWEQMCAKMAEYSHRCGDRFCQPAASSSCQKNCGVPMYDPRQMCSRSQGHPCPKFPREPFRSGPKIVPPVLKRFLPLYQRPDLVEELKVRDAGRLIKEQNERSRRYDRGQVTTEAFQVPTRRDQKSTSRKILTRPSIVPERTESLPYQERKSFKNVVDEYRRSTVVENIDDTSPETEVTEEKITKIRNEPLLNLSKIADKTKAVRQLFPPIYKIRASAVAQMTSKIVNVFKSRKSKTNENQADEEKIAGTETLSEMSTSANENKAENRYVDTTSAEETTDNKETAG